jgi:hypothetical protein
MAPRFQYPSLDIRSEFDKVPTLSIDSLELYVGYSSPVSSPHVLTHDQLDRLSLEGPRNGGNRPLSASTTLAEDQAVEPLLLDEDKAVEPLSLRRVVWEPLPVLPPSQDSLLPLNGQLVGSDRMTSRNVLIPQRSDMYSSIPVAITRVDKQWKLDADGTLIVQPDVQGRWAKPNCELNRKATSARGFPLADVLRWDKTAYEALQVRLVFASGYH